MSKNIHIKTIVTCQKIEIGENPSYQIKTDSNGNRSTNGKEHYDSLVDKLYEDKFITKQENSEIAKITEDLRRKVVNHGDNKNEKNENVSRVLQDYFMNNVGDGKYPAVTEEEKEFIKNAVGNYKESDNTLGGASFTTCTVGDGAGAKFDVAKLTESGSLWKELN